MTPRQRVLVAVLPMVVIGPLLSGFVHELGHALVVWGNGGRLKSFQPLWFLGPPHLHYEGTLGPAAMGWMAVSGVLAVVLVSWLMIVGVPYSRMSHRASVATAVVVACLFSQLLAWVFLPCLAMIGFRPRDDVIEFLAVTGWHPLVVASASGAVLWVTLLGFLRRTSVVRRLRALRAEAIQGTSGSVAAIPQGVSAPTGATPGPSAREGWKR